MSKLPKAQENCPSQVSPPFTSGTSPGKRKTHLASVLFSTILASQGTIRLVSPRQLQTTTQMKAVF